MHQGKVELFGPGDAAWLELLGRTPHDVFHHPGYHQLPGLGHEGSPHLLSYTESDGSLLLWPYLLRPIPDTGNHDVSSVYGYAGPVSTGSPEFHERAWPALLDHWRRQGVVSVFTRFHPMLGNAQFIGSVESGKAELGRSAGGSTVSIDLTLPSAEQIRRYQKVLRQQIRKSRELGFVTTEDGDWENTGNFVRLYRETMTRRNSREEYLVDEAWVNTFRQRLGTHARLFVTKWRDTVAAALLAIEYSPYLHAHLTGIDSELATYSPLKVMLDDVREWGTQRPGLQSFHLGGGLGGREDSLFQFKRKFSPVTHTFETGRWILDAARYRELESAHAESLRRQGYRIGNPEFFPIYRYQPVEADLDIPEVGASGEDLPSGAASGPV